AKPLDDVHPIERLRPGQGVHLPRGCHAAHDRQVVSGLLLANDRRLSLGAISPDQARQEVEARFVLEGHLPALTFGPPEQFGPDFDAPALDGLLVTLDGPLDRHLGRPVQFLEQASDMTWMVANAELFFDDQGDAGAGPDLAGESVGLRSMPEEFRDQPLLTVGEFGGTARR